MNIAVVDGGGHMLAFRAHGQVDSWFNRHRAKKGKDVGPLRQSSEALWEFCKPGGPAPATEGTNGGLILTPAGSPSVPPTDRWRARSVCRAVCPSKTAK